ncbi:hypothetical protein [Cupriavidus sp. AcVe19-6a]|uniref:hypothetical protein n=1 Tax=Cupriavidus sp. AcVe19-6a TaxID=2821358 RepID=UPI001AE88B4F|nr:hypothetical protein [Cupriavidus sp. AcVe19-6a]
MNAPDRPARHELDLERFVRLTLGNLSNCYAGLKPGRQVIDFIPDVLNVVGGKDDPSVETPVEIIMQFVSEADKAKGPDWIARSPNGSLIISCAYCLRALGSMKSGDLNLAWSYMADARYWCGVAISGKGINEAREQTIMEASAKALATKAKSGAEARSKTYEPVRERVYQLARERKPGSGWRSRTHAVNAIRKEAHAFSVESGPELKQESLSRTLDGWLAKMPDAAALFPSRKAKD